MGYKKQRVRNFWETLITQLNEHSHLWWVFGFSKKPSQGSGRSWVVRELTHFTEASPCDEVLKDGYIEFLQPHSSRQSSRPIASVALPCRTIVIICKQRQYFSRYVRSTNWANSFKIYWSRKVKNGLKTTEAQNDHQKHILVLLWINS